MREIRSSDHPGFRKLHPGIAFSFLDGMTKKKFGQA